MRRLLMTLILTGLLLVAMTAPALAINDVFVPADECSPDHSDAVGNPFEPVNPGIDLSSPPVGRPTSANNPGASTGANGQERSQAPAHCNSSP